MYYISHRLICWTLGPRWWCYLGDWGDEIHLLKEWGTGGEPLKAELPVPLPLSLSAFCCLFFMFPLWGYHQMHGAIWWTLKPKQIILLFKMFLLIIKWAQKEVWIQVLYHTHIWAHEHSVCTCAYLVVYSPVINVWVYLSTLSSLLIFSFVLNTYHTRVWHSLNWSVLLPTQLLFKIIFTILSLFISVWLLEPVGHFLKETKTNKKQEV